MKVFVANTSWTVYSTYHSLYLSLLWALGAAIIQRVMLFETPYLANWAKIEVMEKNKDATILTVEARNVRNAIIFYMIKYWSHLMGVLLSRTKVQRVLSLGINTHKFVSMDMMQQLDWTDIIHKENAPNYKSMEESWTTLKYIQCFHPFFLVKSNYEPLYRHIVKLPLDFTYFLRHFPTGCSTIRYSDLQSVQLELPQLPIWRVCNRQ